MFFKCDNSEPQGTIRTVKVEFVYVSKDYQNMGSQELLLQDSGAENRFKKRHIYKKIGCGACLVIGAHFKLPKKGKRGTCSGSRACSGFYWLTQSGICQGASFMRQKEDSELTLEHLVLGTTCISGYWHGRPNTRDDKLRNIVYERADMQSSSQGATSPEHRRKLNTKQATISRDQCRRVCFSWIFNLMLATTLLQRTFLQ